MPHMMWPAVIPSPTAEGTGCIYMYVYTDRNPSLYMYVYIGINPFIWIWLDGAIGCKQVGRGSYLVLVLWNFPPTF